MLRICSHKRPLIKKGLGTINLTAYKCNSKQSVASKISERIRQAVEDYYYVDGLRITISGGTSQYNNETITELVHSADTKLYTVKRNGKNQIVSDAKF